MPFAIPHCTWQYNILSTILMLKLAIYERKTRRLRELLLLLLITPILLGLGQGLYAKGKPADKPGGGNGGGNGGGGGDDGGGGDSTSPIAVSVEITSTMMDELFADGTSPYQTSKGAKTKAELNGSTGALLVDTNTSKKRNGGRTMSFFLKRSLLQSIGIDAGGGPADELVEYQPEQVEIETDPNYDLRLIEEGGSQEVPMVFKTFGSEEFWVNYGGIDDTETTVDDVASSFPVSVLRENVFTWIISSTGVAAIHGPDINSGGPSYGLHDVSFSMRVIDTATAANPPSSITVLEEGYRHASLRWPDAENWDYPWLIQRSTVNAFVDPTDLTDNQAADNTGNGTFRWLGVNANNYVDLDGLSESTTYYYRVAACTNLSDHYQNGDTPTFTSWIEGTATTGLLEGSKKTVYDVTQPPYNAIPGDGENDYYAILAALADAEAAGGGVIYLPTGTYDVWPVDSSVSVINGIPTILEGSGYTSTLFLVSSDNITFQGDLSGSAPSTYLNFYLWEKVSAQNFLSVTDATGSEVDVRRYYVFQPKNVRDLSLKNLAFDMGAVPVDSTSDWWTLDNRKNQWDISHKFLSTTANGDWYKNVLIDGVTVKNGRGEMIYNGGNSEKMLIKNSSFSQGNASLISGSIDLEMVNVTVADGANSAIEVTLFNRFTAQDNPEVAPQNMIARECQIIGLDQSASGVMKDLPGEKNFAGWHVFNEEGTYQTITDSVFRDCVRTSFGPWYEYRNGFRFNCVFHEYPDVGGGNIISTNTKAQTSYQLDGGMSEILWLGDTVYVTKTWSTSRPFFYSQPGPEAAGSETPWTWEAVHFQTVGGPHQIYRLWLDTWQWDTGRDNVLFKDWTKSSDLSFDNNYLWDTNPDKKIHPTYVNFFSVIWLGKENPISGTLIELVSKI